LSTSYPDFPEDILTEAARLGDLLGLDDYQPIAESLMREREGNANVVKNLRLKLTELQWGNDCGYEIANRTREWTKEIIGVNATFVDDDLRVLAHLANLAVQHGLTLGLNDVCRESIRRKTQAERTIKEPQDDSQRLPDIGC